MQKNISVPEDEWFEEWTSDDFMALPERVDVLYENEQYNPKLQYMTGVARDDASYMICKRRQVLSVTIIMQHNTSYVLLSIIDLCFTSFPTCR